MVVDEASARQSGAHIEYISSRVPVSVRKQNTTLSTLIAIPPANNESQSTDFLSRNNTPNTDRTKMNSETPKRPFRSYRDRTLAQEARLIAIMNRSGNEEEKLLPAPTVQRIEQEELAFKKAYALIEECADLAIEYGLERKSSTWSHEDFVNVVDAIFLQRVFKEDKAVNESNFPEICGRLPVKQQRQNWPLCEESSAAYFRALTSKRLKKIAERPTTT